MTCTCMREPDPGICEGDCVAPSMGHCRCWEECDNWVETSLPTGPEETQQ